MDSAENQVSLVEESAVPALVTLSRAENDEVQQDCARALCNLSANEENHTVVYRQGGLASLVELTQSAEDVCQRYAAMGLRFLASNPEVRVYIVKENMVAPFLALAESPLLEYQRTAATALASFTLSEENKASLVRQGGLRQILSCCLYDDLQVTGQRMQLWGGCRAGEAERLADGRTDTRSGGSASLVRSVLNPMKRALSISSFRLTPERRQKENNRIKTSDCHLFVASRDGLGMFAFRWCGTAPSPSRTLRTPSSCRKTSFRRVASRC